MRMLSKLIAITAGAATVTALAVATASADPINLRTGKAIEPRPCDVVGGGSNTIEYLLNQLSVNFNKARLKTLKSGQSQTTSCARQPKSFLYSWDALANAAATTSPNIKFKSGCTAVPRPNGSSAGVADLATDAGGSTDGHVCFDFARSSRPPKSTDPTTVTFVALAQDNVTWAAPSKTNAPKSLTTADLHAIYSCTVTHWNQVGGSSHATIHPLLPQPNSGTLAFFEAAIGITTPGSCVVQPVTLEENEGVDPIFRNSNARNELIPFSAGKWASQQYRSPACASPGCPTDPTGVFIKCKKPTRNQNAFGCNVNGVLRLHNINGTNPLKGKFLNPPKSPANPRGYTVGFVRTLFDVVRGTDKIPSYLSGFFGPHGFFCTKGQRITIGHYGFEPANIPGFPKCGSKIPG